MLKSPTYCSAFYTRQPFSARLGSDPPGILVHQARELLVVLRVLSHNFNLVCGHIAADGLAVFTVLQVVIGPVGTLTKDANLAGLHPVDLGDLLEKLS